MKFKKQLQDETIANIISMLETIREFYQPEDTFTNADIRNLSLSFDTESIDPIYLSNDEFMQYYERCRNRLINFYHGTPKAKSIRSEYPRISECLNIEDDGASSVIVALRDKKDNSIFTKRISYSHFFVKAKYPKGYNPSYLAKSIDLSDVFTTSKEPIDFEVEEPCWCVAVDGKVVPESEAQGKRDSNPFVATVPRTIETERYVYSYNREALEKAIKKLNDILAVRRHKQSLINDAVKQAYDYSKFLEVDIKDVIKGLEKLSKGK